MLENRFFVFKQIKIPFEIKSEFLKYLVLNRFENQPTNPKDKKVLRNKQIATKN